MYNKLFIPLQHQSKWYTFKLLFGILLRYHLQSDLKKQIKALLYKYDRQTLRKIHVAHIHHL
jgi:ATP/maltotriose-dependent transcriptional regulator MalT